MGGVAGEVGRVPLAWVVLPPAHAREEDEVDAREEDALVLVARRLLEPLHRAPPAVHRMLHPARDSQAVQGYPLEASAAVRAPMATRHAGLAKHRL